MDIQNFIQENWNNPSKLQSLIGVIYTGTKKEWNFGQVPTNKIRILVNDEGKITAIKTWSGFKWTAKGGYGDPSFIIN